MLKRNRNMCVKIAKDVLKQLRLGRYLARQNDYVLLLVPEFNSKGESSNIDTDGSFQKFFKENKQVTCEVCALGSAFVSLVNIENKCPISGIENVKSIFTRLSRYFGRENIVLMESAFECKRMNNIDCRVGVRFDIDINLLDLAIEWGDRYISNTKRLRAIMLNVIRNKGDFKIPKKMLAKMGS